MSHGFRLAIAFTLRQEDARDDAQVTAVDLGDGGGLTKYGITAASYPGEDIAALTVERAMALYERDYWEALALYQLPIPLAVMAFDAAVNQGPKTAIRLLQETLGVPVDGVLGPVTAQAARDRPDPLQAYTVTRAMRYMTLQSFPRFGRPWLGRLLRCLRYCEGLPE